MATVVLAAAAMLVIASGWWTILRSGHASVGPTDGTVTRTRAWTWFFAGEIGKYVPGTVWPILGRGELAVRGGVARREAYRSVFHSLALFYLACAAVAALLLPWSYLLIAIAVVVAARLLPVRIAVRYLPAWAFIGTATWTVARGLDPDAPFVGVVAAAAASWLAGFLAVPVPGGVGVREAVFVALAPTMAPGVAETTAVAVRVAFVGVDAVAALVSWHRLRR